MNRRLARTSIFAVALFSCTAFWAPLVNADEEATPAFSFERAKKVLLKYLRKTDGKDVFIIGYRPVSSSEVEIHYLVSEIYVGPMKVLLINTDSGQRWYLMSNPPLPVK